MGEQELAAMQGAGLWELLTRGVSRQFVYWFPNFAFSSHQLSSAEVSGRRASMVPDASASVTLQYEPKGIHSSGRCGQIETQCGFAGPCLGTSRSS
jgi:hypothetical protein